MKPLVMDLVENLLAKGEHVVTRVMMGSTWYDMSVTRVWTCTYADGSLETVFDGEFENRLGVICEDQKRVMYPLAEELQLDKCFGAWRLH